MNKYNNSISPKELFSKLKRYYDNNSLYEDIQAEAYYANKWIEANKPLRTVVNRSVEFYVSKILPGDLSKVKISAEDRVREAIEQVWQWSNFASQKQLAVRYLALYGNLFWKAVADGEKVYFEIVEPKHVTDFKTDNRGYITEIRLDVPMSDGVTHTEYWNKEYYSVWEHKQGEAPLDQLNKPIDYGWLEELGIDFVPFVHVKFRDTGEKYGAGSVLHALDKIDEANRESTRLTQLLFRYNKPTIAVNANDKDAHGRPLPAPKISLNKDIEFKDDNILYIPGMATVSTLVPQLDYASALNILNAMMDELEQDLPELRYYSIKDSSISGRAIKLLLAGAVDKAEEARGNFLQGLSRLNMMALTLGSFWNLFNVGTYEKGDYEHSIIAPEMFTTTLDEKATSVKTFIEAGMPLEMALKFAGFSDEEVEQTIAVKDIEDTKNAERQAKSLATSMMSFNGG